ncbi:MAG: peptidase M61, partial [Novosphingobium sp.]
MKKKLAVAPLILALSVSTQALAANSAPMAVPIQQTVPDAQDVAYPGTMMLDIDATDVARGDYKVTQIIPVAAGAKELILLYPQWLPGNHGPRGPLAELVGVQFFVDGKPVEWKRDRVEVYAFHVMLPAGAKEVVAKLIHTSPLQNAEGRITMTPEMLNLQWEKMSLYPAGHYVRRIRVKPTVTLPQGWTPATALDGMSMSGNRVTWAETDYETLVDSPIFAGKYFKKWDLGQNVTLNVVADKPEQLEAKPEHIAAHSALVQEAKLAFGANHFDHYEFLLALSDKIGGIG